MAEDDDDTDGSPKRPTKAQLAQAASELQDEVTEAASDAGDELEERVASLREQLADLAQQVEDFAEARLEDARDLALSLGDAGATMARRARRQTAVAVRAVRDDPLPLVVALGVVALLTAVFVARSEEQRSHHHRWRH